MPRSQRFLAVAAVLVAVLLVWLLRTNVDEPAPETPSTSASVDADRPAATAAPTTTLEAAPRDAARAEAEIAAPPEVADATTIPPEDIATLVGRVVDARGAPIADARIALNSVGGPWARGRDIPKKKSGEREYEIYEAHSGADGRFRLEVIVPTSDWISMSVSADVFHGRDSRDFGPAGGRDKPRLTAGDTDFGDIALASCGVLRGRVRGDDGTPIAKAHLRIEDRFPGGMVVGTVTQDDGTFELGGIPPGTWKIGAKATGWISNSKAGIEVAVDRAVEGFELVLERAPTISGIVVGEAGVPIPNVRVYGWPTRSGQGAGAKTDEAGRFTLHLPQLDPYDLEVTRQPAFEDWGDGRSPAETFAPGTSDVRIVLKRNALVRFRVVDAASGAPIPKYSLQLEKVPERGMQWNRFSNTVGHSEYQDGEVELPATVDKQEVGVSAPGYASLLARVALDADGTGVQTLRLQPESRIVARLVRGGDAVGNATVRVERDRMLVDPTQDPDDMWAERRTDVDEFAGRKRSIPSNPNGSLRIGELAPGTYRVTIEAPGIARLERDRIVVAAGAEVDLGTVELAPASRVAGRVLVPVGASPIGMEVRVGDAFNAAQRISSADGSFTIDGLAPGTHTITLASSPPILVANRTQSIELGPGETRELIFDLVASAPCAIELEIVSVGRPVIGVRVVLVTNQDGSWSSNEEPILSDEHGVARGLLRSGDAGILRLLGPMGRELHEIPVPGGLPTSGLFRQRVELALGSVVVELPRDLVLPESGMVNVVLKRAEEMQHFMFQTSSESARHFGHFPVWSSHTLTLEMIPAGEYVMTLHASQSQPAPESAAGWTAPKPLLERKDHPVRIASGTTTTVDLR